MSEFDLLHTGDPGEKSIEDFSTAELVSELRKRDGVYVIDVPAEGDYLIQEHDTQEDEGKGMRKGDALKGRGHAIILRITD